MMPPLWPHQREALAFVADKPAAMLAMVMRSGKSRVTVEALEQRGCQRVILFCPKTVVDVWPEEFAKYGQGWQVLSLKEKSVDQRTEQAKKFMAGDSARPRVVIINHDSFWRDPFLKWAMTIPWDAIVMDESHRLKNPGGMASRGAARLAHGGLANRPKIPFRLQLTGTPMPHDPLDIYAQYRILDPTIFGTSYGRLKDRYAVSVQLPNFGMIAGYKVDPKSKYFDQELYDEFQEKFFSIAYQVGPEVLNLPEPLHITRTCTLSPKAMKIYKEMETDFYTQVDAGEVTAANAMVKAMRLQQMSSGYVKLADSDEEMETDTAKFDLLKDMLGDLDEPVVVFCRFRHDLDAVHRATESSLELSGRVNQLLDWQQGKASVLAVQTQAGGVGIDLSRARVAIYYSLGLSLGDHLQSLSRLQKRDMGYAAAYYYLIAENTVDVKVAAALQARKEVIEAVLRR